MRAGNRPTYAGHTFLANELLSRVEIPFAGPLTAPARAIHFGMIPDNPPRKPWMRNAVELLPWPLCADDDPVFAHHGVDAARRLHHSMMTAGGKK